MNDYEHRTPTIADLAGREVAVLERAAAGLFSATGVERVYCAVLVGPGSLRFTATAPVGAGLPGSIEISRYADIERAVREGVVVRTRELPPPYTGAGGSCIVPWMSQGEVLGIGVLALPQDCDGICGAMLALIGGDVGETLRVLRDCASIARHMANLRDVDDVLHAVIEDSSDAMKIMDLDGQIVRWNTAAEKLYGWTEGDVRGEFLPHIPEGMRLRALTDIRVIAAAGHPAHRQVTNCRAVGSEFEVDVTVVPFTDADGDPAGVLGISRPLAALAKATEGAHDMGAVLARMMKSSLTAVAGYAQLLTRTEILNDSARRKRTLDSLERRAHEASDLVDALILTEQLSAGVAAISVERVDPAGLVADAVVQFEQSVSSGQVLIDYEATVGDVQADRRLMARALQLLLNRITQDVAEPHVEVCVLSSIDSVIISVSIQGDSREIDTVENALREEVDTNEMFDETELAGMIETQLLRRIIEAHRGTFDIAREGAALTARVSLPLGVRDE